MEDDDENADLVTRATWLRAVAGHHTGLANKLINVARRMKTKASNDQKASGNKTLNMKTFKAYKDFCMRYKKKKEAGMKHFKTTPFTTPIGKASPVTKADVDSE